MVHNTSPRSILFAAYVSALLVEVSATCGPGEYKPNIVLSLGRRQMPVISSACAKCPPGRFKPVSSANSCADTTVIWDDENKSFVAKGKGNECCQVCAKNGIVKVTGTQQPDGLFSGKGATACHERGRCQPPAFYMAFPSGGWKIPNPKSDTDYAGLNSMIHIYPHAQSVCKRCPAGTRSNEVDATHCIPYGEFDHSGALRVAAAFSVFASVVVAMYTI